jgi:hypothetical protein
VNFLKRRFYKIYALVAIHDNRLKFFITYILSNTRFLIRAKKLAFILAWQAMDNYSQYFYFILWSS